MKTHKDKATEKNSTFDILDEIQEVKVSPYFKNRVLHTMMNETSEEPAHSSGWFTAPLQFATIALVLLLNVSAIIYYTNSRDSIDQVTDLESFAKTYHLGTDDSISLN